MNWNAYIDESGDRGWSFKDPVLGRKVGSSRNFAMTAVLVPAGTEAIALDRWDKITGALGRPGRVTWKQVTGHSQRRLMVGTVAAIPDIQTISVVLCKPHLPNASRIRLPGALYNWTFRLMIERLSWFGNERGETVNATFAQVGGVTSSVLADYTERLLNGQTYIRWENLGKRIGIDTPANRRMLQVADAASGAVFGAFEPDAWGLTEQCYLEALEPVIWLRSGRPVWRDGVKYGPNPPTCDAEHPWFASFCDRVAGRK